MKQSLKSTQQHNIEKSDKNKIFSDSLSSTVSIVTEPSWTTDEMGFHSLEK
jgi:hypothetical protein